MFYEAGVWRGEVVVGGEGAGEAGEAWRPPSGLDVSQRRGSVEAECQHDINPACVVVEETLCQKNTTKKQPF